MENPSSALSRHQFQSKKATEKGNDRISQLPDAVLHYILSLMPMKFMVRTSILSKRWRNLWKDIWAYSTALDFGAEFATGQTREEFVSTVNQYLQLHQAKEIEVFRLSLIPCNLSYAEKWVKLAGAKGAKEVDIHFRQNTYDNGYKLDCLPHILPRKLLNSTFSRSLNSIFSCDSITQLNLSCCYLHRRLNFKGYPYLKKLQLSTVRITNALFESMLSNCPLLEELILRNCQGLTSVKVSTPNLPLKRLTLIDCWYASEIEIFAPNLQSFHFYGSFISMYFKNILSLVDVLLNGMFSDYCVPKHDWITILHHLGHVKILTLCYVALEFIDAAEESATANLPVTFHNLQELQLLLEGTAFYPLAICNSFFKNCPCPCLEKLFIELSPSVEHPSTYYLYEKLPGEDPLEIVFDHLKVIKMTGFIGGDLEMQLVKYFLERSIVLELLVLVAPQNGVFKMKRILRKRLSILAKASTSNARILISEYSDDDGALVPTHTDGDGSLVRTDIY
ncbi:putative F-box/FBD/LRR-repeat protein At1g78760 [Magnolia sinica]|uniref:putative F-box/FBD/LRR-repeat protein At1g78760 n=1 Tax=Magnolia sinica TaxID=86752 RepID=UPI00265B3215|nr:putative F-box/FBD/LRR-repeat protein At1g78760 [Magnolia sinica]